MTSNTGTALAMAANATPKRGAGRPRIHPVDSRVRTLHATDSEWEAIKNFLAELRKNKPDSTGSELPENNSGN